VNSRLVQLLAIVALAILQFAAMGAYAEEGLPPYEPESVVTGTIRFHGFGLGGVLVSWQQEFQKFHPGVKFQNDLRTSDAAFPALITGVSDLAPDGGEPALTEWLGFYETHGYHATDIVVATGSFDTEGRSNGPVILVHEDNPLTKLTIDQLDGIFGSARSGGLRGFVWTPADARGAEKDIRTWGELGLTGKWADKPIQTYGHAPSGASRFFQLHVLASSDKWNPNYRGYVETGSKMMAAEDTEQTLGIQYMLRRELARDRYGIAWTIMSQAKGIDGIKVLAIAPRGTTRYATPSQQSFQDRSYPLARNIYIYVDRKPGAAVDPKLREFLRFVLSRDGQRMVSEGGYLALPAWLAAEQRRRLD
jgi:phosphate transport system substrate-binding protein